MKTLAKLVVKFINLFKNIIVPEDKKIASLLNMESYTLYQLLPKSNVKIKDIRVLFDYQNKIVKLIIKSIKYKNNPELKTLIAGYLYDEIIELDSEISLFEGLRPIIVPMPMSNKEKRGRGFNQCEELLKTIEKISENNIETSYNALTKIRETERQTNLSKENRLQNVKNSMFAKDIVKNRTVIVLDDVYTTLASFSEASRALKNAGAKKVLGIFIAH